MSAAWDDLVAAAVQGTARRPADPSQWGDPLGSLGQRLTGDPAVRLLDSAAVATTLTRAGARLHTGVTAASDMVEDALPLAPPSAHRLLQEILEAPSEQLVTRFLERVAQRGERLHPWYLPTLLRVAEGKAELRPAVLAVLGERGRWLAQQHPTWRGMVASMDARAVAEADELDESVWAEGTPEVRMAWLHAIASGDFPWAVRVVERDWSSLLAPQRREALSILAFQCRGGHNDALEALAERGLDDRARDVRTTAQQVLRGMVGSRLAARAAERVLAWVSLEQHRGVLGRGSARLHVSMPSGLDMEAVRDGLNTPVPGPVARGMSDEARWLRAAVAAAPLAVWQDFGGPDRLIAMLRSGVEKEWADPLLAGWLERVNIEPDPVWLKELDAVLFLQAFPAELVGRLPEPQRTRRLETALGALTRVPPNERRGLVHYLVGAVQGLRHPWPADLAPQLLDAMPWIAAEGAWALDSLLLDVAEHEPLYLLEDLVALRAPMGHSPPLERAIQTMTIRRRLDEEIPLP